MSLFYYILYFIIILWTYFANCDVFIVFEQNCSRKFHVNDLEL